MKKKLKHLLWYAIIVVLIVPMVAFALLIDAYYMLDRKLDELHVWAFPEKYKGVHDCDECRAAAAHAERGRS